MIFSVLSSLRWCLSLASKFSRVVFFHTMLIIFLTLTSQLSALLASFLPLKVVILLGSESVPHYIPEVLRNYGRETLILALSLATATFFIFHLTSERLVSIVTDRASRRLLLHNKKVVLFENQDAIAASSYQKFSRVLAGIIFSFLAIFGVGLFYPDMSGVFLLYLSVVIFLIGILGSLVASFRQRMEGKLYEVVSLLSGIGFFTSFAYLVADFIFFNPPSIIVAIISLLLVRQSLNRLVSVVKDTAGLYSQRVKVDALFFHGKVLLPPLARDGKTYWPFLEHESRNEWVESVLAEMAIDWRGSREILWHPSSHPGLAVLIIKGKTSADNFMVKLYETNRTSLALHESTLLTEPPKGLLAAKFMGATNLGGFPCHVFRLPENESRSSPNEAQAAVRELRAQLLQVVPPDDLVQRYMRSKALLWQRLTAQELKRLNIAVSSASQKEQVTLLLEQLPRLQQYLCSLPLVFINPDMRLTNAWVMPEEAGSILLNWGRWSLEPVGAGFGMGVSELNRLGVAVREAIKIRPVLATVDTTVVELAALGSALEEYCKRQQFLKGLEVVEQILLRLDVLGRHGAAAQAVSESI